MADPIIPNIPASIPADQAAFFQGLKSSIEYLMGQDRNLDETRALRVRELENMGIDVNSFLNCSARSPYQLTTTSSGYSSESQETPDAPTALTITKGAFSHTLTWANPEDDIISCIEIWASENSQQVADASLLGIVTVTDAARGETAQFINSGFDSTADFCYWIRSVSYAGNASEWHPSLVQGGVGVAGDDSIAETIAAVIDILNGGTPDVYSGSTTYSLNDRCRTSDGRVWTSIYASEFSGVEPPNATYWERTGILMQGDVDGAPTIAIDGNLMVDGTILARHLAADSVKATQIDTNEVFVGMTIQSSNFISGSQGWKISRDGNLEIYGGVVTIGSGSNGYVNLSDKPTSLNHINSTEYGWASNPAGRINTQTTTVDGGKITTYSVSTEQLAANAVTSDKINVTNLQAVSSTMGNLTVNATLTMGSTTGTIKSSGKSYGGATNGFILGVNAVSPYFDVGNSTTYLRYYNGVFEFTGKLGGALVGNAIEARSPEDKEYQGNYTWSESVAFNVGRGGNFRIRFEMWSINSSHATYARIYKNGSPVGTQRSATSTSVWLSFSQDINSWSQGDRLAIYTSSRYSGYKTKIRNVEICSSNSPVTTQFL